MRLFGGAPMQLGLASTLRRWMSTPSVAAPVQANERRPSILVDNSQPPKWESGLLKV